MEGFAGANRVVFVEPFGSWVTLARVARWQKRRRERKPMLEQVGDGLWVFRPPPIGMPGISRWRWPSLVNGWILAMLLRLVALRLGFRNVILWSFLYNSHTVLRSFPAGLTIYECGDNDEALARDDRQRRIVRSLEAATCRSADLVFACTEELTAPRRRINPRAFAVNCAADLGFFGRALDPDLVVPPDLAAIPRPVVGYLGGVDPWKIDIPLLLHIARRHPEWNLVLVGYVWFGFDPAVFADCPNIHVLGPKDYEDFPALPQGDERLHDALPAQRDHLMGDALKLYEYLAAGRPVVSTSVPAARRLAQVVRIAETPEAFVAAIEAALSDPPRPCGNAWTPCSRIPGPSATGRNPP